LPPAGSPTAPCAESGIQGDGSGGGHPWGWRGPIPPPCVGRCVGRRRTVDGRDRVCLALTKLGGGVPRRLAPPFSSQPPPLLVPSARSSCRTRRWLVRAPCPRSRAAGSAARGSPLPTPTQRPPVDPGKMGHRGIDSRGTRRGASEGESERGQRMPPRVRAPVTGELGERESRAGPSATLAPPTPPAADRRESPVQRHDTLQEQRVVEKRRVRWLGTASHLAHTARFKDPFLPKHALALCWPRQTCPAVTVADRQPSRGAT